MRHLQLTLFLLLAMGFLCGKKQIITKEGRTVLTALVIDLFLPCSIIRSFCITFDETILKKMGIILLIGFAYQFGALAVSRFLFPGAQQGRKVCMEYGIICSNAGFMGQPMAENVLGAEGLLYASVALIPIRLFMWSAGLALFTASGGRQVIRKLLTHPCMVAVYIGLALMILGIPLPVFLDDALRYTANCTTAVSMIVIGAILSGTDIRQLSGKGWMLYYSLLRLAVIPLMLYAILTALHVERLLVDVTVLMAAMPAGSTTAMLAASYDGDAAFASGLVFVSTLLSMITLPFIAMLF